MHVPISVLRRWDFMGHDQRLHPSFLHSGTLCFLISGFHKKEDDNDLYMIVSAHDHASAGESG